MKQRQLWKVLKEKGPLRKAALAAELGVQGSEAHLYDRFGLTELRDLRFVINTSRGYDVGEELPARTS